MSDFQIIPQKIKEIAKDLAINPESLTQDRTEFLFDDEKAQNDVEANIQVNINESAYEGNGNSFIGNVVDSIATLFGVSSSDDTEIDLLELPIPPEPPVRNESLPSEQEPMLGEPPVAPDDYCDEAPVAEDNAQTTEPPVVPSEPDNEPAMYVEFAPRRMGYMSSRAYGVSQNSLKAYGHNVSKFQDMITDSFDNLPDKIEGKNTRIDIKNSQGQDIGFAEYDSKGRLYYTETNDGVEKKIYEYDSEDNLSTIRTWRNDEFISLEDVTYEDTLPDSEDTYEDEPYEEDLTDFTLELDSPLYRFAEELGIDINTEGVITDRNFIVMDNHSLKQIYNDNGVDKYIIYTIDDEGTLLSKAFGNEGNMASSVEMYRNGVKNHTINYDEDMSITGVKLEQGGSFEAPETNKPNSTITVEHTDGTKTKYQYDDNGICIDPIGSSADNVSEIKDDTGNKLATVTQENDTTIRIIREKGVSTDKLNMPDKSDEYAGKTVIVDRHDKDKDYRKIYVYDENGYLSSITDNAKETETTFVRDYRGQITRSTVRDTDDGMIVKENTYYDGVLRYEKTINPDGTSVLIGYKNGNIDVESHFDKDNKLVSKRACDGQGTWFNSEYTYDEATGRRTGETVRFDNGSLYRIEKYNEDGTADEFYYHGSDKIVSEQHRTKSGTLLYRIADSTITAASMDDIPNKVTIGTDTAEEDMTFTVKNHRGEILGQVTYDKNGVLKADEETTAPIMQDFNKTYNEQNKVDTISAKFGNETISLSRDEAKKYLSSSTQSFLRNDSTDISDRLLKDILIVKYAETKAEKAGEKGSVEYIEAYNKAIESQIIKTEENMENITGEVVEKSDGLYVNDGNGLVKLNISKETYLELFPPIGRYDVNQHSIGDCFFVSSVLTGCMENQVTFSKLLQMFSENENGDITVQFEGLKDYPVTFENGNLRNLDGKVDGKSTNKYTQAGGSKGIQMIEQAYATSYFAACKNKDTDEIDIDEAIKQIADGGDQHYALQHILGEGCAEWCYTSRYVSRDIDFDKLTDSIAEKAQELLENYYNYRINEEEIRKRYDSWTDFYNDEYKFLNDFKQLLQDNGIGGKEVEHVFISSVMSMEEQLEYLKEHSFKDLAMYLNEHNQIANDEIKIQTLSDLEEKVNDGTILLCGGFDRNVLNYKGNNLLTFPHGYIIRYLDVNNKTAIVSNPWCAGLDITLNENEFMQYLGASDLVDTSKL